MKRKWIIAIAAIAVLCVGIVLYFVLSNPYGGLFPMDVTRKAFLIDKNTEQVGIQTTIALQVTSLSSDSFEGAVTVEGYPDTGSGVPARVEHSVYAYDSGLLALRHFTWYLLLPDGERESSSLEIGLKYTAYLHGDRPELLVVSVTEPSGESEWFVCAEDEETALEEYRWFLEKLNTPPS